MGVDKLPRNKERASLHIQNEGFFDGDGFLRIAMRIIVLGYYCVSVLKKDAPEWSLFGLSEFFLLL